MIYVTVTDLVRSAEQGKKHKIIIKCTTQEEANYEMYKAWKTPGMGRVRQSNNKPQYSSRSYTMEGRVAKLPCIG